MDNVETISENMQVLKSISLTSSKDLARKNAAGVTLDAGCGDEEV